MRQILLTIINESNFNKIPYSLVGEKELLIATAHNKGVCCVCGNQRSSLAIFLDHFLKYFLRKSLADTVPYGLTRLSNLGASGIACLYYTQC